MTFDEYQKKAIVTDVFGGKMKGITDAAFLEKAFGLVGEAGELAEKFKKIIRDKGGELSDEDKAEIGKELGDVLWYVSGLSFYLGVSLDEVASKNIAKLASRAERNRLSGSGDNR